MARLARVARVSRVARVTRLVRVGRAGLAGLALLAVSTGCSGGSGATPPAPAPAPRVAASVTQFRFDEGTDQLRAGIVNDDDRVLDIADAEMSWPGFTWTRVRIDEQVPPGQAAAFMVTMGRADCAVAVTRSARMVATIDGVARTLPVEVQDAGLLVRLHHSACARQDLAATADVGLVLDPRPVVRDGQRWLSARLHVVRHRADALRVVDLGGSVLLILDPVEPFPRGGRAVPADAAAYDLPIRISVRPRCDPHARSQSSQTFLLSAYVRLADHPTQRVILPLTAADRAALNHLIDQECR